MSHFYAVLQESAVLSNQQTALPNKGPLYE